MATITILGAGVMGTAMSIPFSDNGHHVRLVGTHLDTDIIREIETSRIHPGLGIHIPEQVSTYTADQLDRALKGIDLVLLGVNSLGIKWAAEVLGPILSPETPILLVTKGLVGDGRKLMILPELLRSLFPATLRKQVQIAAIGGPAIAGEVAVRRDTCVIFTGPDPALLDKLAQWSRTKTYHVWTSTDLSGIETCVAMKNAYAMAVGLVQGMAEKARPVENSAGMHDLAAAIFAQGLWETAYLVDHMQGQPSSVYGLPGAGDLHVTCQGGRNSRMGRLLGMGLLYDAAKAQHMADDTVEGAELARAIGPTIEQMIASHTLDGASLPLLQSVINIICHNAPVDIPWDQFFHQKGATS
jgi:glycerol-3-phosphate dehydrogenase (NAD(P)+)